MLTKSTGTIVLKATEHVFLRFCTCKLYGNTPRASSSRTRPVRLSSAGGTRGGDSRGRAEGTSRSQAAVGCAGTRYDVPALRRTENYILKTVLRQVIFNSEVRAQPSVGGY